MFPETNGYSWRTLERYVRHDIRLIAVSARTHRGIGTVHFTLAAADGNALYAETAVYVAPEPTAAARGPYLAERVGSQTRYAARVPFPAIGWWSVLVVVADRKVYRGAATDVRVPAAPGRSTQKGDH